MKLLSSSSLKRGIRELHSLHRWDSGYQDRRDFFQKAFSALSFNGIDGDYAEFGCWSGKTFSMAYRESQKRDLRCHLWAFDSFCGLPPQSVPEDQHPVWIEGHMKVSLQEFTEICRENGIPESGYSVVPGFYADTIGGKGPAPAHLPNNISLAYVDCDLYSSTRTVMDFLYTRMKHGMVLAFDDYYNWSANALAGERLALLDFLDTQERFCLLPYIQFGWYGMSFVVEETALRYRSRDAFARAKEHGTRIGH